MRPPQPLKARFKRFVEKTSRCWVWTGGTTRDGYGKFQVPASHSWDERSHTVRAHRVAWYLKYGKWPPRGKVVLHTCDNPLCVKPSHLRVGTHQDNVQDMYQKGRGASQRGTWNGGVKNPERARLAKLTWPKVRKIRKLARTTDLTQVQIAEKFGVSDCTVRDILKGRTWVES